MNAKVDLNILSVPYTSKILSVGRYLPSQVVKSNDIFSEFNSDIKYGIPENWMSTTMGIKERRMVNAEANPSDLAIPAAQEALDKCNINPDEIGLVIFCGIERDQAEPATAHTIQRKLGLKASQTFDVSNACFGFIDGLRIANNFISSGDVRNALVVTGEVPTKLITAFVERLKKGISVAEANKIIGFLSVGDAGGAVVMGRCDSYGASGFKIFNTETRSKHSEKCYYKHLEDGEIEGQMIMAKIVSQTLKLVEPTLRKTLSKIGWNKPDYFLTHQVGKRAFDEAVKFNITPKNRMIKSYEKLGNITSATFPINHYDLIHNKQAKIGDKIYCCYSGSGIVIGQFGYTL